LLAVFKLRLSPVAEATTATNLAITCIWIALAPTRFQQLLLRRLLPGSNWIASTLSLFQPLLFLRHAGGGSTHPSPTPFS
jgi:hypothetical protein